MKSMTEKDRKHWEKTRAKGFDWYVIKWTVLFGVFIPIWVMFVDYIFDEKTGSRYTFINFILFIIIIGFLIDWWTYE